MTNLEKLTELQHQVGYVKGPINIIAILGLVGESGEVLKEFADYWMPDSQGRIVDRIVLDAIDDCRLVDTLKKDIRDKNIIVNPINPDGLFPYLEDEMADVFYYLNALCINRGITLEDLARISYAKVVRKSQIDVSTDQINAETYNPCP